MILSLSGLDFGLVLVYFAALIIIGYLASKRESKEDFLIAERKLDSISTMATINASKTGSILMIFVALVYLYGFSALWYFIGMTLGVLVFLPFALKLKDMSKKRYYTLADYFKYNYGKASALFASLITIFIMFGFLILNLIAGTKIFVFFTGWSYALCAMILVVVVMIYLLLGGFKAVVKTDVMQYIVMLVILVILVLVLFNGTVIPASDWNFLKADFGTIAGFFIVGLLFPFAMPDMWQRVYASKNKKTLKKGILSSAVVYFIFAVLLSLVALTIKARFPGVDPDLALVYGFQAMLPAGVIGLSVVLLFAAIMSSIDTYLFTATSGVVQDLLRNRQGKAVSNMKKGIVIIAILGTGISILLQDLVIGSYIFVASLVIISVCVISSWINKRIKESTLLSGFTFGAIGFTVYLVISLSKGDIQPTIVIIALGSTLIGIFAAGIIGLIKKAIK